MKAAAGEATLCIVMAKSSGWSLHINNISMRVGYEKIRVMNRGCRKQKAKQGD